ncbi:MAG TPA: hypothetical protein IAB34_09000 [Candidatus Egerieimonas faecigallinarum]|nr:hypothetical protein [Candidatus Egerieimonas faecigallinarum]
MKKKLKLLVCTGLLCTCLFPQAVFASSDMPASDSGIETYADKIGWKYKIINGELYKRQYNYTTGEWIGDWVKA